MPRFASGASEAKTRSGSKGKFPKSHFFGLDDGEQTIVRFLTDMEENPQYPWVAPWATVEQHQNIPTKPQPQGFPEGRTWPKRMGVVCRHAKLANGQQWFPDCYICDEMRKPDGKPYKAQPRTWALACLREEVVENGVRVGYRDAQREVAVLGPDGKPTDQMTTERAVVMINLAWKNFFGPLSKQAGMYGTGTVMDRDYIIRRDGEGFDTEYAFLGADIIPGMDARLPHVYGRYCGVDPDKLAAWKADPSSFVPERDGQLLTLPVDLDAEIDRRASEDFYARWFDPTKTVEWGGGSGGDSGNGSAPVASSQDPETKAKLDALANRVKSYGSPKPAEVDRPDQSAASVSDLG